MTCTTHTGLRGREWPLPPPYSSHVQPKESQVMFIRESAEPSSSAYITFGSQAVLLMGHSSKLRGQR